MDSETSSRKSAVKVGRSVADILRARILTGDLAPGQRLIETDILAELHVGRSALREAFVLLDAEGLVELRHQRGAAVVRLTRSDMAELFAVRERLEGFAAWLAAERVSTPGHREWLLAQRQTWMRDELLRSERAHMEENVRFHEGIVRLAGNARLAELLTRMWAPAYRQKFLMLMNEERLRQSAEEHLGVIEAILAGDPERAEALMRAHVRRTGELAQRIEGLS